MLDQAQRWADWSLASQRADGSFGPSTNPDWWPRMVMLKVLTQHAEATDDARVVPFLERYLAHVARELPGRPLEKWGQARGAENVLTALWLYERNGDPALLDLAALIERQTLDWAAWFVDFPAKRRVRTFDHFTHVVNVAMAVKQSALRWLRTGDERDLAALHAGLANLDRYHGQPQGMFSGDEWLAESDPSQGVELCAVVELAFSLEQLVRLTGDVTFADRLERVIYNALPATISANITARQYDQQPNQVLCTIARRNWTQNKDDSNIFGLEPNFGCCTANLHQGWPKFVKSMWMATPSGGLAAIAYGPCSVETDRIRIDEITDYPFRDDVRFEIHCNEPVELELRLRVPGWCSHGVATLPGGCQEEANGPRWLVLRRTWRDGDAIDLSLPAPIRVDQRPSGGVAIQRGSLTFTLRVGEEWRRLPVARPRPFGDFELHPTTAWNYALAVDPGDPTGELTIARHRVSSLPWDGAAPPLVLRGRGRRVPSWGLVDHSAGPVPASPVASVEPLEPVELTPYGSTRLRVTELPITAP